MERILIVEDEVKIREELKTFLENNGYEILTINNFENTLDQIKKTRNRSYFNRYKHSWNKWYAFVPGNKKNIQNPNNYRN